MAKYSLSRKIGKVKKYLSIFYNRKVKKTIFTKEILNYTNLKVGEFTYGEPEILVFPNGETSNIYIGKYCSIANGVKIFAGGNHRMNWVSTFPFNQFKESFPLSKSIKNQHYSNGDVTIGNDVWIGNGATILSGVNIKDGAVIGANTLVTKDVGPYQVVVGNPMRVIKNRFEQHVIEELLQIQWWNWPLGKVQSEVCNISSGNIEEFVKKNKAKS